MPAPPVAYLFADHHAGGGYPGRNIDDSDWAMQQIAERALADGVSWLISLGDAVDAQRLHADGPVPLRNRLRAVAAAGVRVGYIDGNHDKRHTSWLDDPEFTHLDGAEVELAGRVWAGLDFRPRGEIQAALDRVPDRVTGLFMHQAWADFLRFEDAPQCAFADVPAHVTHLATGDFHGDCIAGKTFRGKGGQKLLVCNPGATSLQEIREPERKFFCALRGDGTFARVPLKCRRVIRSDQLATGDEADEFLAALPLLVKAAANSAEAEGMPEALWKPLVHVSYAAKLEGLPRRVEKAAGGLAHLFWTELRPQQAAAPGRAAVPAAAGEAATPLGKLREAVRPGGGAFTAEDEEVYALAEALYHCPDARAVAARARRWFAEQLEGP